MGLLNARNMRMAKQLLEKNRDKVGGVVEKAGEQLDKVSKGKTSNVTSKASEAAHKYSSTAATQSETDTSSQKVERGEPDRSADPRVSDANVQARKAEATASAATAVKGVADAFTGFLNRAAAKAEAKNSAAPAAGRSTSDVTDSQPNAATNTGTVADDSSADASEVVDPDHV